MGEKRQQLFQTSNISLLLYGLSLKLHLILHWIGAFGLTCNVGQVHSSSLCCWLYPEFLGMNVVTERILPVSFIHKYLPVFYYQAITS